MAKEKDVAPGGKLRTFHGTRFEVKRAFRRGLENGDKLQLVLECPYTRELGIEAAKIDGVTVDITMVENPEQPQLPDHKGGQPDKDPQGTLPDVEKKGR